MYRGLLHNHVMHKMKNDMECDPYSSINIALVLTWVCKAWKALRARTISHCFSRCGFRNGIASLQGEQELITPSDQEALIPSEEAEEKVIFHPPMKADELMKIAKKTTALLTRMI